MTPGEPGGLVRTWKPHRFFFPVAALWALLAVPAWLLVRAGVLPQPALLTPPLWHATEMLFGYALAVVAGYLLPPVGSLGFLVAFGCWLAGRIVWFLPNVPPAVVGLLVATFPVVIAWHGVRRFRAAKRARNQVFAGILIGLPIAAALLLIAGARAEFGAASTALRIALYLIVLLIMVVGGRLIPAATIGAFRERGREVVIRVQPRRELLAILAVLALLVAEVLALPRPVSGVFGLLIGGVLILRMKDWQSRGAAQLPEIWPLHLGYAWIAVGFLLLGVVRLGAAPGETQALHALAAGGIGTVTLAMMARLTRLRSPRRDAPRWLTWIHGLFGVAVLLRVAGTWAAPAQITAILWLSAACWSLAYAGLLVFLIMAGRRPADAAQRPS